MSWEQSKSKSKNEKKGGVIFEVIWPKDRGVGDGWVEWAIAHPCFGRSISQRAKLYIQSTLNIDLILKVIYTKYSKH